MDMSQEKKFRPACSQCTDANQLEQLGIVTSTAYQLVCSGAGVSAQSFSYRKPAIGSGHEFPVARSTLEMATKKPVWCVLLTATIAPFVDLTKEDYGAGQNRDLSARVKEYLRGLELWANNTALPIIFAENSGAGELSELRQKWKEHLTPDQQRRVEVLDLFDWARDTRCSLDEIGCHEAHAIRGALIRSQLIKDAGCAHVLKANGRWFAYDIESVLGMCNVRQPWPVLVTQNPRWQFDPDQPDSEWRQESQIMGFNLKFESSLFGWADTGAGCMECQISEFVRTWRSESIAAGRVCDMPPLRIDPNREGSTGVLRTWL